MSAARCDDWAIESFTRDGTVVLGGSHTSGYYTVEWAPTLTNGEWYADWSELQQIPATGGMVEVAVPMFYRAVWNSNLDVVVTEHSQLIGTGNGLTASFADTLNHTPVLHATLQVAGSVVTFTDDRGDGFLSGTPHGSRSIDYTTGDVTANFALAPASGVSVIATYRSVSGGPPAYTPLYHYANLGTGNGLTATFDTTVPYSVVPKTLFIRSHDETFADRNGNGYLVGSVGGFATVDYDTGVLSVTFWSAPSVGTSIIASYVDRGTLTLSASRNPIPNGESTTVMTVLTPGTTPYAWTVLPPTSGPDAGGSIVSIPAHSAQETYGSAQPGNNRVQVVDALGRTGLITITQQ